MPQSLDDPLRSRLPGFGLKSTDRGGGGDCWWHCNAAEAGISMQDLRIGVAQLMRENEHIYGLHGNFEAYGGYQRYCDLVATPGVYVEGNAEIPATADYITRHILILGAREDLDVYIFAGSIGNGTPVQLDNETPIILAHWRSSQHYTGTAPLDVMPWSAPKGSKRARIKELNDLNFAEAAASASALASLILRSRALAEEARTASTLDAALLAQSGSVQPAIHHMAMITTEPSSATAICASSSSFRTTLQAPAQAPTQALAPTTAPAPAPPWEQSPPTPSAAATTAGAAKEEEAAAAAASCVEATRRATRARTCGCFRRTFCRRCGRLTSETSSMRGFGGRACSSCPRPASSG